jgi:hypothetical protein
MQRIIDVGLFLHLVCGYHMSCNRSQLKAIEELKDKARGGAKLETTQYKKIETEGEIRKELAVAIAAAGGAA